MRYKLLGKSGLRVSELCLGTMTFGEAWGWGASKEASRQIFEAFVEAGGNFIDTANGYTNGASEKYLGEFVAADRDYFVVGTKYTLSDQNRADPNAGGNHRKNMIRTLEVSLKQLNTDYVDLYWLHMWDAMTPIEEVMRGLDDLVRSGKVRYVGVSDTPAWVVARANTLADLQGWSRFIGLQVEYNLMSRTAERDLLPMAWDLDIGVLAFGLLEGGQLTGKYNQPSSEPKREEDASPEGKRLAGVIMQVAAEIGRTPSQVAINWVRQKWPGRRRIIPILGARTETQMKDNLGCLEFELSPEHYRRLAEANPLELGFPHYFIRLPHLRQMIYGQVPDLIDNHRI
jgi:aryl-alcohol dehydrogenase-like predicted oxidoreductase